MADKKDVRDLKSIIKNLGIALDAKAGLACSLEQVTPSCQKCNGKGIYAVSAGATVAATVCHCIKNCSLCCGSQMKPSQDEAKIEPCCKVSHQRRAQAITEAGLPARYASAALERFSNKSGNHEAVLGRIKEWLNTFDYKKEDQKGLLIQGGVGIGKTYLLVAIAKRLANHGIRIKYVDFFQLILDVKARMDKGGQYEKGCSAYIKDLIEYDVLVIDEIGKGQGTDFEMAVLDQLVDGRYSAGKVTIGATNYEISGDKRVDYNKPLDNKERPLDQSITNIEATLLFRVGDRIFTRIVHNSVVIEWERANNIRLVEAQKNFNITRFDRFPS